MDAGQQRERTLAVQTALAGAATLAVIKLVTAIATGSLSILASFLDSLFDLFASALNVVAIRIAARPADADHTYGHGKAESLAGLFQGVVIGLSGVGLAVESVRRVVTGNPLRHTGWGIAVLLVSMAVTGGIVWRLRRALKRAPSPALRAESAHYANDVLVNGAVLVALAGQELSGLDWVDPLVSTAVSAIILRAGWRVLHEAIDILMDRSPPTEDIVQPIRTALAPFADVYAFHSLRSRLSGTQRFIDLHLDMNRDLSFAAAHALTERASHAIQQALRGATVLIHADPFPPDPYEMSDDAGVERHVVR